MHGVNIDGSMILDYLPNYKPKYIKNNKFFRDNLDYYKNLQPRHSPSPPNHQLPQHPSKTKSNLTKIRKRQAQAAQRTMSVRRGGKGAGKQVAFREDRSLL